MAQTQVEAKTCRFNGVDVALSILLESLFLWHSGTSRWFTLDLAPGSLKTALIWTLYGSILDLILSAALGRTRLLALRRGSSLFLRQVFSVDGYFRSYVQPLLSTG